MADIFSPTTLGALTLSNRIVMAPMTRGRAGQAMEPTDLVVEYYRQRASAGLIVTEGTQPSPHGQGYWRTPGIHSAEQIAGWKRVADAVHGAGGQIVMQLMHAGRAAVKANKAPGAETVAPSAIRANAKIPGPDGSRQDPDTPRALETEEVRAVVEEHAQAARNARAAGMDGVELHCTSGYLPMQFLSTGSNHRTDRYGGSTANRIRFVVETLEAMADAVGADRVGFRIYPGNPLNDMHDDDPADTYGSLLEAVDGLGLAYLHLIYVPSPELDTLRMAHEKWHGPIVLNNDLTFERARELIAADEIAAASFGRAYISNPDLIERFRRGAPIRPFDRPHLYTGAGDGDHRGYTDYPTLAEELAEEEAAPEASRA